MPPLSPRQDRSVASAFREARHGLARSIHALRASLGLAEPVLGTIKAGVGDPAQVRGWLVQAQRAAADRFLAEGPGPAPPTIVLPVDEAQLCNTGSPCLSAANPRFTYHAEAFSQIEVHSGIIEFGEAESCGWRYTVHPGRIHGPRRAGMVQSFGRIAASRSRCHSAP